MLARSTVALGFVAMWLMLSTAIKAERFHESINRCMEWGWTKMKENPHLSEEELNKIILSGPGTKLYDEFLVECKDVKEQVLGLISSQMANAEWERDSKRCADWIWATRWERNLSEVELARIILSGRGTTLYGEFVAHCENVQENALFEFRMMLHRAAAGTSNK